MRVKLFTLETLSNLHVGSGEMNLDIIDNKVQRDPITTYPAIYSSSLKGALREHFESIGSSKKMIGYIFGKEPKENEAEQMGAVSFFEAKILSLPVRSSVRAYFNATTPAILQELLRQCETFNIQLENKEQIERLSQMEVQKGAPIVFGEFDEEVILEDFKATSKKEPVNQNLIEHIALFNDADFKAIELPVLARNRLDNGKSVNLWYEEVVPSRAKFYFFIAEATNINDEDKEEIEKFYEKLEEQNIVQIGANRSIGYGFCKMTKIGASDETAS